MLKTIAIVILFAFDGITPFCTSAQTPIIDSLKKELYSKKSGEDKFSTLVALCKQYYSLNTDTFCNYAKQAHELAMVNNNALAEKKAQYFVIRAVMLKGRADTAMELMDASLGWFNKHQGNMPLQIDYILLKGGLLTRGNNYKDAITTNLEALKLADNVNDTLRQAKAMWGIGWAYMEMMQNQQALSWLIKALSASSNPAITSQFGVLFNDIAATYDNLSKLDSALYFAKKAINICTQAQALSSLANAYFIEGTIYDDLKQYNAAENDFKNAVRIRQKIGDMFYTVSDMAELSGFYAQIKQPGKGLLLARQGIDSAIKYRLTSKLLLLYQALCDNYKAANDYVNYGKGLEKMLQLKDSGYAKNSADAIADMEAKYDTQKKETVIVQQKYDLEAARYFTYAIAGLFVLVLVIVTSILVSRKQRQKIKIKEIMLENEKATILAVNQAKEEERQRIIADLHDDVGGGLSTIRMVSDLIAEQKEQTLLLEQYAGKISGIVRDVTQRMNTVVWALNMENDTLQNLSEYIREYGYSFFDNSQIEFKSNLPETTAEVKLSGLQRKNLFLCVKEALNNAYKHSGSRHVWVTIVFLNSILTVVVQDDGKGIEKENSFGNGLKNMRKRMAEINGSLIFEKTQGTKIQFEVILALPGE